MKKLRRPKKQKNGRVLDKHIKKMKTISASSRYNLPERESANFVIIETLSALKDDEVENVMMFF